MKHRLGIMSGDLKYMYILRWGGITRLWWSIGTQGSAYLTQHTHFLHQALSCISTQFLLIPILVIRSTKYGGWRGGIKCWVAETGDHVSLASCPPYSHAASSGSRSVVCINLVRIRQLTNVIVFVFGLMQGVNQLEGVMSVRIKAVLSHMIVRWHVCLCLGIKITWLWTDV